MTAAYRADTDALGLGRPDHEPLASETIGRDHRLHRRAGRARARLCRRRRRLLPRALRPRLRQPLPPPPRGHGPGRGSRGRRAQAGPARLRPVEGPARRARTRCWESPWGAGRPGWHIECSAMAEQLLGVGFDIHGGGSDLLFPHHENEAAQTRAARGQELARLWMHNGMIQFTGEKMAKSVGNIAPLHEVLDRPRPRGGRHVPHLRPLPPAAGLLRGRSSTDAGQARAPHPRGAAAADAGRAEPAGHGRLQREPSSTRSPTTSTPPRRWPRCTSGCARPTAAARGSGDARPARDARRARPGRS